MHILRFESGKAVEHWAVRDELGMMQQLGVIPDPGQEEAYSLPAGKGSGRRNPMSPEENKAVVRRLIEEVWNGDDPDAADELVAQDVVNHAAAEHRHGIEGTKHIGRWVRASFPDARMEIVDMIAEGDKVAVYVTSSGTHEGEFRGIPPTGKHFSVEHVHWFRLADGKVAEHWNVRDDLGHMTQLGLLPEPGSSS